MKYQLIVKSASISAAAMLAAVASPVWADATPECNNGAGAASTECGSNSNTGAANYATAVGASAQATGTESTAVGESAEATGSQSTSIGSLSDANAPGASALGYNANATVANATAVGSQSNADGVGGSAFGRATTASALNSTAIGTGALATADNSTALGAGSVANVENTVSVGAVGAERQIVNVANGAVAASSTDAVNGGQLFAVQTTADTALTAASGSAVAAAAAQATANSAVAQNTVQDAQILAIEAVNTTQNSRLTALESLAASYTAQIDELVALTDGDRRDARRGTSTALALTTAPMPSSVGGVSYALNAATYRGEQAIGVSFAYRANTDKPFAVTGGASYAGGSHIGARVGVAGEF